MALEKSPSSKKKQTSQNQSAVEEYQRDVIIGMYLMLKDSFARELPEYADHLLPNCDGWQYSPEWPGPRRVSEEVWMNDHPRIRHGERHEIWLMLRNLIASKAEVECDWFPTHGVDVTLAQVEDRIFERAWTHGLQHRANGILVEGVKQARFDLVQATKELKQRRLELDQHEYTENAVSTFIPDKFDEIRKAERKIQLMRVRLHWIVTWSQKDSGVKKAKSSRQMIGTDNYERLIKPEDVMVAWDNIFYVFSNHVPEDEKYRLLGKWYAKTLWQSGASWQQLIAIRRRNRRPSSATTPRNKVTTRRYLSWSEIAQNKMKRSYHNVTA